MPSTYRFFLLLPVLIASMQGSAQVLDLTMDPGYTLEDPQYFKYSNGFGPRNYIPNGSFNFSDIDCNNLGDGGWWYNFTGRWLGYQWNSCAPSSMIAPGTFWPYNIGYYCDFDTEYNFHPAAQEFHAGYLELRVAQLYNSQHRYNYILVTLKKPLTPGVEYAFSMQVTKDYAVNSLFDAAVDRIGAVLLNELPDTLIEYDGLTTLEPFVTTPVGDPVDVTDVFTLQDTVMGAGQKYLVVGVFKPFDEFTTEPAALHPEAWTATYLFDNFKLYRAFCDNANSSLGEDVMTTCVGDSVNVPYQYGTPPLQWSINGEDAGTGTSVDVQVPASDTLVIRLVGDTGLCSDTAYTRRWAHRLIIDPIDTTIFCADPMMIDPVVHYVDVNAGSVDGLWTSMTGDFLEETGWTLNVTLNDSGTYILQTEYEDCVQTDTVYVGPAPPLATSGGQPLLLPEVRPEHCVNMNDGAVIVHDQGYPGSVTFDWHTPSHPAAHDTLPALGEGNYQVRVFDDSLRCEFWEFSVPLMLDSCTIVSGVVSISADLSCTTPDDDIPVYAAPVLALPSGNMAFTDSSGSYSLFIPPGTSILMHEPADIWTGNLCGNNSEIVLPTAGSGATLDLVDTVHVPVKDLAIEMIHSQQWVIGTTASISIEVINAGELSAPASLKVVIAPPYLPEIAFDDEYLGMNGDTLLFDLGILAPGAHRFKSMNVQVPVETELIGTGATIYAMVMPVDDETDVTNNIHAFTFTILGAYDPNDKQVSPLGAINTDFTPVAERLFTYTVRFQNTGNYHATRVLIADTLHPLLDHSTLQLLYASHAVQAFVYEGVLYLDHNGIMLPDSTSDLEGSQGQVIFSLKAVPGATIGDELLNTAYIYFDLNPPIITNTVRNVYSDISTNVQGPLPANASITVTGGPDVFNYTLQGMDRAPLAMYIMDARGALVRILEGRTTGQFSTSGLGAGVYSLVALSNQARSTARFVVIR